MVIVLDCVYHDVCLLRVPLLPPPRLMVMLHVCMSAGERCLASLTLGVFVPGGLTLLLSLALDIGGALSLSGLRLLLSVLG